MDKIILCSIVFDSKRLETTKCTHHWRTDHTIGIYAALEEYREAPCAPTEDLRMHP